MEERDPAYLYLAPRPVSLAELFFVLFCFHRMVHTTPGLTVAAGIHFSQRSATKVIQSAPQCAEYTGAHLECFYTSAYSIRNKQEALAQSQSCKIFGVRTGGKNLANGVL